MVRSTVKGRMETSKKKKKKLEGNGYKEQRQENQQGVQNCLNEAFSSFSLQADTSSTSSSSELCYDSNSNCDDPSSSSSSSELFWESDLGQMPVRGKGFGAGNNKHSKKVVASTGTVSNVIGKGYVWHSPSGGGKRYNYTKLKGNYCNKAASNEEAEQFLCAMLGDECELSLEVVKDVLCQCGYDVEKASDVLLDLPASSQNQLNDYRQNYQDPRSFIEFDDRGDDGIAKSQFPNEMSDSIFNLSEEEVHQILLSSGCDYRSYSEVLVGPKKQTSPATIELNLPQEVLKSLFSIPKSSEHHPDSMNWKNVVQKMESFGQGPDLCADRVTELQQTEYAKGEDYKLFRKPATQHYDVMKSYYLKASAAYSSGQRSYAAYLADQGKVHNKIARVADEKASREIFVSRNKGIQNTVTIDLHGQHVKQAMRLLKVHLLLFTTYVPSVQFLRVITGCGTHGVGKSKLKLSVISLVESAGIKYSEENIGTVLIKLDGQGNFNFAESEDE